MARANACALVLLLGCSRTPPEYTPQTFPVLSVSRAGDDVVSFEPLAVGSLAERSVVIENRGDLPMGIADIALDGSGDPQHFSVTPDLDGTPCAEDVEGVVVLEAGCVLPATVSFAPLARGTLYAAVEVTTVSDPGGAYFADPRDPRSVTVLRGEGLLGTGDLFVLPRTLDFGSLWLGESRTEHLALDNVGDGDVLVGELSLGADCDDFALGLDAFEPALAPGVGTLVAVTYTPTSTAGVQCTLSVPSDDPREPLVEVVLLGNTGKDPGNAPPTVQILGPGPGLLHESAAPILLALRVSDAEQPADSLNCTVSATAQLGGVLGSCTPSDDGGYVEFAVDPADLEAGTETLLVTVTDMDGLRAQASTTVRWLSPQPGGDDDGDGFGDGAGDWPFDCDDNDASVYPGGAELADGIDNNCDLAVDEGTDAADDDGDALSELDGDCDDNDAGTYPGAPEIPDFEDNDCDGIVDEGTAAYDNDGDGYAARDGDCDDRDAARSPAAVEYCGDGIDNDCDARADLSDLDGCESVETRPVVVGGCQLGQRALSVGEATALEVAVYDPDTAPGALRYSWSVSPPGLVSLGSASQPATVLQAPAALPGGVDRETVTIVGIVEDDGGDQAWCSESLTVLADPVSTAR